MPVPRGCCCCACIVAHPAYSSPSCDLSTVASFLIDPSECFISEARTLFLSTSSISFVDPWILFNVVPVKALGGHVAVNDRGWKALCHPHDDGYFVVNVGTTLKTHITRSTLL
jgi:hypothetical protein